MNKLIRAMQKEVWEVMSYDMHESQDWDSGGRVHNWHNHVPHNVQLSWDKMSRDERTVAWLYAAKSADAEEWD